VPTVPNPPKPLPVPWQVIGCTVRGASHVQKGIENQDHIRWEPHQGRVILAVADGHGSARSFRSATGSRFAVDVSLDIASDLLKAAPAEAAVTAAQVRAAGQRATQGGTALDGPADQREADRFLSFVKDQLETDIPRRIVYSWTRLVAEDLARNPFTDTELARLADRDRRGTSILERNGQLAYGSTLVTVIATESFVVFWQIGDGDVVTVSSAGEVGRPVPGDSRLVANETTSLCSSDAAGLFRFAVLGTPTPLIMLSTDGFANSFRDDAGFFKFGSDLRDLIVADGLEKVNASLPNWLAEITARGSGDDVSLGIVCRPPALVPPPPLAPSPPPPADDGDPEQDKQEVPETLIETPEEAAAEKQAAGSGAGLPVRERLLSSLKKVRPW
jgi:Protein phosphatase 2C